MLNKNILLFFFQIIGKLFLCITGIINLYSKFYEDSYVKYRNKTGTEIYLILSKITVERTLNTFKLKFQTKTYKNIHILDMS